MSGNHYAMKTSPLRFFSIPFILTLFISLSAFHPPCEPIKGDSLVIVRVLQPTSVLVETEPVVFISKGLNKIESVEVRNVQPTDKDDLVSSTLGGFLNTGFTIENATEILEDGFQLSTYYLKKKAI